MTTTAHEDQFTIGTQTIEPVRQPYSTEAILRRNVADLELALRTQTERAESYAETLRSLASYVGAGGYNSDTVDAGVFEEKIRWGIGEIIGMLDRANAELAKLREQNPSLYIAFSDCGQFVRFWTRSKTDMQAQQLATPDMQIAGFYSAPIPAPRKGATHCDDCGLTWLDDGLNPLGCPYCKDAVPAPAVPEEWRDDVFAAAEELRSTDCRTCINRGHTNGLSQETYCDSCMWYGAYWKKNNYNPLQEPAP
jgi:hypothetical protein